MKYTRGYAEELLGKHWPRVDGEIGRRSCWAAMEVGDGWVDVIVYAVWIGESADPGFVVRQVKEKFGGLRFYCNLPLVTEMMIENLARNVCENCGEYGDLSYTDGSSPWLKTLCQTHRIEFDYITGTAWREKYQEDC